MKLNNEFSWAKNLSTNTTGLISSSYLAPVSWFHVYNFYVDKMTIEDFEEHFLKAKLGTFFIQKGKNDDLLNLYLKQKKNKYIISNIHVSETYTCENKRFLNLYELVDHFKLCPVKNTVCLKNSINKSLLSIDSTYDISQEPEIQQPGTSEISTEPSITSVSIHGSSCQKEYGCIYLNNGWKCFLFVIDAAKQNIYLYSTKDV
ncbi:hypothetical protein RF11_01766 [Thelohanellus kitauei]|uniref:SH2 domain-containing protein n=1 Tax=Thelohanellus kitauei TaxID=669202 RepID=A0A0C2MU83_THEKT|nr:hypothetical protein RF11_01766 [Thelohanellus kitauei]